MPLAAARPPMRGIVERRGPIAASTCGSGIGMNASMRRWPCARRPTTARRMAGRSASSAHSPSAMAVLLVCELLAFVHGHERHELQEEQEQEAEEAQRAEEDAGVDE